jgi:hypothetical protein
LIATVIGLLQLNDLFETHPANMWISEAALFMFGLSHATLKKIDGTDLAKYSQIIDNSHHLSGTLVLVSLLENIRFTTPTQQVHNNPSHEDELHTLGPTFM